MGAVVSAVPGRETRRERGMMRVLIASLTLSCVIFGARPAACLQAASVPLSLTVTASPAEVAVGGTVSVVVGVKNYKGDAIAVDRPLSVTLHSELSGDSTINVGAAQSSAQTEIRFPRGGVATLTATASKMSGGSAVVVVKAAEAPTAVPPLGQPTDAFDAAGAHLSLNVDVLPQHVHPVGTAWKALVLVTALNDTHRPVAVHVDTAIHLATDLGLVTPADAEIKAGKARAATIQLTSQRPGEGTVWAWTDDGTLTKTSVEYHEAVPSQVFVTGLPGEVLNDGKSVVNVTVFLQDETGATARSVDDMSVKLTSSIGTPNPSTLSIPKGTFFGEALLASPISGVAAITATAPGFKSGSTQVRFVFPILLVTLAGIGGLIGAVVRSGRQMLAGAVLWHLASSIGIGVVFGLLFYALASFGVVASIPKLSIPLAGLPTTNHLASVVLGFFGGYYGRAWLPDPSAT